MTMIALLFLLGFISYTFGDGFSDGRFKLLGTELHWTKWPPRIGVTLMLLAVSIDPPHLLALVALIAFKPLFDIGWSYGNKRPWPFIGTTDWSDKLFHRLGLVELERKKIPAITITYLVLIFVGLLCIFEAYN